MELPGEIVIEILSRLPVKSLMRFKSVCKAWPHLFRDPEFIAKHHHYQTLNSNPTFIVKHRAEKEDCFSLLSCTIGDDGVLSTVVDTIFAQFPAQFTTQPTILGSVNGVLCLYDNSKGLIALWNPATTEFKSIPLPLLLGSIKPCFSNLGFGFDKETNDYKILVFISHGEGVVDGREEVMLYSVKNDSWRRIDSVDVITNDARSLFNPYINGVRYWWAEPPGRSYEPLILSFNFADEVFEQLSLPDFGDSMVGHDNYQLAIINGMLSVVNYMEEDEEAVVTFIAMWSMTEHGVEETWKEVKAPLYSMVFYASSIAVFFQDRMNLVLFDASTQQLYDLPLHGITHSSQVADFTQSLVPLYGREEEDGPRNFRTVFETPRRRLHHETAVKKMRIS